jgi:hypothetical protein
LALFGRRPPARMDSLAIPASENLHNFRLMRRSNLQPVLMPAVGSIG